MPKFRLRPSRPPTVAFSTSVTISGSMTYPIAVNTPVWSGAPIYNITEGQDVTYTVPVFAGGASITLGWHSSNSPSLKPSWVEFIHGANPQIRFNGTQVDANDVSPLVLTALASGQTVLSSPGSITVAPSVGDTWTVPNQSFITGSSNSYDLNISRPASYTAGGIYDIDLTGNPLLTGMTFTEAGVVGVGTAAVGSINNVKFGYAEPNVLPVLTLIPQKTGWFPYRATVYPTKGAVPQGRFLVSPDDPNLRSSTLNTWPDGSARVVIVASSGISTTVSQNKTINLRLNTSTDSAGTDLTVARIGQVITNITINCGTPVQITDFSTPDWVWWKNSQVICARYRVNTSQTGVVAVLDIHAFKNHASAGDYALVECLVENGTINASAASIATPATRTYSATISVNGTQSASHTTPAQGLEIEEYGYRRGQSRAQIQPSGSPITTISQYSYDGHSYNSTAADAIRHGVNATIGAPIAAGATGEFAGQAGKIGFWSGTSWSFSGSGIGTVGAPIDWQGDVQKEDKIIWTGSRWELGMAGGHESGRAWWSATWVHNSDVTVEYDPAAPGTANPGIEIVHDIASMQAHPLYFKQAVAAASSVPDKTSNYGAVYRYRAPFDKYVPYYMGRLRTNLMNDGGDDEHIALYTEDQADYLLTSNKLIQRVVIANGLAWTGFAEHWRDQTTNQPPLPTQIGSKNWASGNWPYHWGPPAWGGSQHEVRAYTDCTHLPAISVMPFMCRPSPYFIEQAQHYLAWWWQIARNGVWLDEMPRGRGWGTRNLSYASFLTPDNLYTAAGAAISQSSRKAEYAQALTNAATAVLRYKYTQSAPANGLNYMYGNGVNDNGTVRGNDTGSVPGWQDSPWLQHIAIQCFHMVDKCELLTGTQAATFAEATDWMAAMPVRRVIETNAAGNTAWRMQSYKEAVGTGTATADWRDSQLLTTQSNWNTMINQYLTGTTPTANGPWLYVDVDNTNWQTLPTFTLAGSGYNYQDWFLTALSCAVERDITDASAAWDIVVAKFSTPNGGLSYYMSGYSTYTRYNRWPRNK